MAVNKCTTCFYAKMDKDLEAPCASCTGYSNWIPINLYNAPDHGPLTVKEAIDSWFNSANGIDKEDFEYDVVDKPKHYMLFAAEDLRKEEGIEVRDVIEALVSKIGYIPAALFTSDYVQMMQYLMRFMDKNGVEDLKKARWYLDKLIGAYDEPDF